VLGCYEQIVGLGVTAGSCPSRVAIETKFIIVRNRWTWVSW